MKTQKIDLPMVGGGKIFVYVPDEEARVKFLRMLAAEEQGTMFTGRGDYYYYVVRQEKGRQEFNYSHHSAKLGAKPREGLGFVGDPKLNAKFMNTWIWQGDIAAGVEMAKRELAALGD